jgi:hypothetical protein
MDSDFMVAAGPPGGQPQAGSATVQADSVGAWLPITMNMLGPGISKQ